MARSKHGPKMDGYSYSTYKRYTTAFSLILPQTEFLTEINTTKWVKLCSGTKPAADRPRA